MLFWWRPNLYKYLHTHTHTHTNTHKEEGLPVCVAAWVGGCPPHPVTTQPHPGQEAPSPQTDRLSGQDSPAVMTHAANKYPPRKERLMKDARQSAPARPLCFEIHDGSVFCIKAFHTCRTVCGPNCAQNRWVHTPLLPVSLRHIVSYISQWTLCNTLLIDS